MEKFEISVTQNTAVGADQSEETTVYCYCWKNRNVATGKLENGDMFFCVSKEQMCGVPTEARELVAEITVHHPWVMAGSAEETEQLFYSRAERELAHRGLIEQNDAGVWFWIGGDNEV